MAADPTYSLEALERRWQLEKTPPVGLRLAEEYRRKGDLDASIGALTAGLEVYPNHTASRVALSRYLVDGGRFAEAILHLEKIVALDPAHLVANKLLVGAYAGVGRVEDGRDKLAIYEMMAEGDADIEGLHRLLDAAADIQPPEPSPEPLETGGPFDEVMTREVRKAEAAIEPLAFSVASLDTSPQSPEEPFGSLPALLEIETSDASRKPVFEPQDEPFGEPLATGTVPGVPGIPGVPEPGAADVDSAAERADMPASAPAPASVTLGHLYKQQGHSDQAREVFEQVLERDPENLAARREVLGDASAEDPAVVEYGRDSADLAERKREILIAYRSRLRQAVAAGI